MGAAERLWLRGGFPRSFLASSEAGSFDWRRGFIRTFLERDLPALGVSIPGPTLNRFWQMLAHYQGQVGRVRGDDDDGDVARARVGLQTSEDFIAVHVGQVQVEQHDVRAVFRGEVESELAL